MLTPESVSWLVSVVVFFSKIFIITGGVLFVVQAGQKSSKDTKQDKLFLALCGFWMITMGVGMFIDIFVGMIVLVIGCVALILSPLVMQPVRGIIAEAITSIIRDPWVHFYRFSARFQLPALPSRFELWQKVVSVKKDFLMGVKAGLGRGEE